MKVNVIRLRSTVPPKASSVLRTNNKISESFFTVPPENVIFQYKRATVYNSIDKQIQKYINKNRQSHNNMLEIVKAFNQMCQPPIGTLSQQNFLKKTKNFNFLLKI